MTKSPREILQLHWMDGAKLSGGSYANEPSLSAGEALTELKEAVLAAVGEDRYQVLPNGYTDEERCRFYRDGGYNFAKSEIRKAILTMFEGE